MCPYCVKPFYKVSYSDTLSVWPLALVNACKANHMVMNAYKLPPKMTAKAGTRLIRK